MQLWDEDIEETEEVVEEAVSDNQFLASPVVQKIEKAKLYQMLLTSDFFEEDAAEEEIVQSVTTEIRRFVHYRLECLLGTRSEDSEFGSSEPPAPVLPWDDNQIQALTAIANRLLKTESSASTAKAGGVKKVSSPKQKAAKASPNPRKTKKVTAKKEKTSEEKVKEHFEQYKSVDNPDRKPMPSQMEIDTMNAQQANQNAGNSFGSSTAGGLGGDVAKALIQRLT